MQYFLGQLRLLRCSRKRLRDISEPYVNRLYGTKWFESSAKKRRRNF